MFTGIVQEVGTVTTAEREGGLLRLTIAGRAVLERAVVGDSIAVDGVCLTIVSHDALAFSADAMTTTLERTAIGDLVVGARVNLERALAVGEPMGGHIVQGHVDGVGIVRRVLRGTDSMIVDVAVPTDVSGVTVVRGSITLSGVSLTVAELPEPGVVRVSLIPYTLEHTTLGEVREGMRLNVEADVVAKLVAEQTRRWLEARAGDGIDVDIGANAPGGSNGIRHG
jgi:riboflavin synthase